MISPRGMKGLGPGVGPIWIALFLCAQLFALSGAHAGPSAAADHVRVRLVSAVTGTAQLKEIPLGLDVTLDDGWKTYWRAPGDAGLPPALDWSGSTNLAAADLLYPAPRRISVLGIDTFGYKHHVLFPLDVHLKQPGAALDAKLKLDLLVCAEQCVPYTFKLDLDLPAGAAVATPEAQEIAAARAAVPDNGRASGLDVTKVEEVSFKGAPALSVEARAREPFAQPDLAVELGTEIGLAAPHVSLSDGGHAARFVLPLLRHLPPGVHLTGRDARVTLFDGARAAEARREVLRGASVIQEDPGPSLAAMLALALLGGLILNLMPCVLPVLSLKFISIVGHGGQAPRHVRASLLATAAGIVVSFLGIASALYALKSAGKAVGWGLQFQQPGFIAGMAVLVTIFAWHLLGLFEIPLPRAVARAASRLGPERGLVGAFVTGLFATLLATPCSAPFLGTAVAFALAGEAPILFGIFLALGLGLALPYLAVAAVPHLAARLPKPGRWMLTLKRLMALPLMATAVWFLTILAAQAGLAVALATGVAILAVALLLIARDRLPQTPRRAVAPMVLVLTLGAMIAAEALPNVAARASDDSDDTIAWTAFDRARIRGLVAEGRTVFVDVTADWCLTCKANKRLVLAQPDIAARLNKGAVSMKADWTRPDPAIGAYLASYGRFGIPFNIVYGPGAPAGIVLPELLSSSDVTAALDRAGRLKASAIGTVPEPASVR